MFSQQVSVDVSRPSCVSLTEMLQSSSGDSRIRFRARMYPSAAAAAWAGLVTFSPRWSSIVAMPRSRRLRAAAMPSSSESPATNRLATERRTGCSVTNVRTMGRSATQTVGARSSGLIGARSGPRREYRNAFGPTVPLSSHVADQAPLHRGRRAGGPGGRHVHRARRGQGRIGRPERCRQDLAPPGTGGRAARGHRGHPSHRRPGIPAAGSPGHRHRPPRLIRLARPVGARPRRGHGKAGEAPPQARGGSLGAERGEVRPGGGNVPRCGRVRRGR